MRSTISLQAALPVDRLKMLAKFAATRSDGAKNRRAYCVSQMLWTDKLSGQHVIAIESIFFGEERDSPDDPFDIPTVAGKGK